MPCDCQLPRLLPSHFKVIGRLRDCKMEIFSVESRSVRGGRRALYSMPSAFFFDCGPFLSSSNRSW